MTFHVCEVRGPREAEVAVPMVKVAKTCLFRRVRRCGDVVLHGRPGTLTLRSTLHTPLFTHVTLHSTLYFHTSRFTLHTAHSPLHTLNSTLYTLHSTLYTLHFTLHTLHSTLFTRHFTHYTPHSTIYTPHSTSTFDSGSSLLRFLCVICKRVRWFSCFGFSIYVTLRHGGFSDDSYKTICYQHKGVSP